MPNRLCPVDPRPCPTCRTTHPAEPEPERVKAWEAVKERTHLDVAREVAGRTRTHDLIITDDLEPEDPDQ